MTTTDRPIPRGKLAARQSLVRGEAYVVVIAPGGYEQVIQVCPDLTAARAEIHRIIIARAEEASGAQADGRPSAG